MCRRHGVKPYSWEAGALLAIWLIKQHQTPKLKIDNMQPANVWNTNKRARVNPKNCGT